MAVDRNAATRAAIAKRLPEVRVGDRWTNGAWGDYETTVISIKPEDGLEWPLVTITGPPRSKRDGTYGAPAFLGAVLVVRGEGKAWLPPR